MPQLLYICAFSSLCNLETSGVDYNYRVTQDQRGLRVGLQYHTAETTWITVECKCLWFCICACVCTYYVSVYVCVCIRGELETHPVCLIQTCKTGRVREISSCWCSISEAVLWDSALLTVTQHPSVQELLPTPGASRQLLSSSQVSCFHPKSLDSLGCHFPSSLSIHLSTLLFSPVRVLSTVLLIQADTGTLQVVLDKQAAFFWFRDYVNWQVTQKIQNSLNLHQKASPDICCTLFIQNQCWQKYLPLGKHKEPAAAWRVLC